VVQTLLRPINMLVTTAILTGFARAAPWHLPPGDWRVWVLGFFAVDFAYYWFHRWSHEIAWMWATHAVHHSPPKWCCPPPSAWGGQRRSLGWLAFVPLVLIGLPPKLVGILAGAGAGVPIWAAHRGAHHAGAAGRRAEQPRAPPRAPQPRCRIPRLQRRRRADRVGPPVRHLPPPAARRHAALRAGASPAAQRRAGDRLGPFAALLRQMAAAPGWGEKLRIALGRPR
jgi:hypothetical protein